jgi:hypothetical protein
MSAIKHYSEKRRRASDEGPVDDNMAEQISLIVAARESNDPAMFASALMRLMGYDQITNPPPLEAAELFEASSKHITELAHSAVLTRIAKIDRDHVPSKYFGTKVPVSADNVIEISEFLCGADKIKLCCVSRSWKKAISQPNLWHSLDPFPVRSFANFAEMKTFLDINASRFRSVRSVVLPRIPSSSKLFHEVFQVMPRIVSLSLQHIVGRGSLRQCMSAMPLPSSLLQLSLGHSTLASPEEIASALGMLGSCLSLRFVVHR